jgi:hypothetical protein
MSQRSRHSYWFGYSSMHVCSVVNNLRNCVIHGSERGAFYHQVKSCRFHVDNLSSAHVYLRLPDGGTLQSIPPNVLEECCQIVKHNSIKGCKLSSVDIVYTLWSNLKKTASMEVRVSLAFHHFVATESAGAMYMSVLPYVKVNMHD